MKFFTIALSLGAAAVVQAQATSLPTCAQTCLGSFTSGSSIGGCSSLDISCICSSQSFLTDIACCLEGACSAADQATAIGYAQQICETAGVTVPDTISAAGSCSSSTASASSTGDSSSSTGDSSSSTSGSASTTGTVAAASTTGSTTATKTSSSSTSHSSTSSSSATASSASSTANAASENFGRPAGVLGAVAAALFLL